MEFGIRIQYERKWFNFTVQVTDLGKGFERYKVLARNKTIILESNRPLLRNRGLKSRRPNWTLIEGRINSSSGLDSIKDAILEKMDNSPSK